VLWQSSREYISEYVPNFVNRQVFAHMVAI